MGGLRVVELAAGESNLKVTVFFVGSVLLVPSVCKARATGGLSPPLKNVPQIYQRRWWTTGPLLQPLYPQRLQLPIWLR